MGASSSKPGNEGILPPFVMESISNPITHDQLYELTKKPRKLMGDLLDYMLKEMSVRDFLQLSNPEQCNKYVLFMTNSLNKFFYELKIEPTRDNKGIIAFRSIKDVITPPSEQEKREKESLCLILSYFYVRIFQIYGALALTLIDDISVVSSTGILSHMNTNRHRLIAPGLRGGAIDIGFFKFLTSFIYDDIDPYTKGYKTKYKSNDVKDALVSFNLKPNSSNENQTIQDGIFFISYKGNDRISYIEVSAKRIPGTYNIELSFTKIRYFKKGARDLTSIEIPSNILSTRQYTIIQDNGNSTKYTIKGIMVSINDFITDILSRVIPYIKKLVESTSNDVYIKPYEKEEKDKSHTLSEIGTEEQLRLHRIYANLKTVKPLGHCIARALSLAGTIPLKNNPGFSYICKSKFLETSGTDGTKFVRSGIPPPGMSLDESPGLAALSQLFYDTIAVGTPKIVIGQNSMNQYVLFMKNMATLFGDKYDEKKELYTDAHYKDKKIKGIKNRRDKELCASIPEDIPIPASDAKKIYAHVSKMFETQYKHSIQCGNIFRMLFKIIEPKDGIRRITFSENIIKLGIPEVERINKLTRDVLIKYYSTCETEYLHGMKDVLDSHARTTAAKASEKKVDNPIIVKNPQVVQTQKVNDVKKPVTSKPSITPIFKPVGKL